jgi:hypothetical protein
MREKVRRLARRPARKLIRMIFFIPTVALAVFLFLVSAAFDLQRGVTIWRKLIFEKGTWILTSEDVMEPPQKLRGALVLKGIDEVGVFDVTMIGETRIF